MKRSFTKVVFVALCPLVILSCQKSGVEKTPLNAVLQSEYGGDAIIKNYPADLQDIHGQTPINIAVNNTVKFKSIDPVIHYEGATYKVTYNPTAYPDKTEYNLKATPTDGDNYITIKDTVYKLLQFHFHYGSEHAIQGSKGLMEVHLVHQSAGGKLAVLGVLIYKGGKNEDYGEVFEASPENKDAAFNTLHDFDVSRLLPANANLYYTYSGSLTTPGGGVTEPPYLEGLTWIVFKGFKNISPEQYNHYTELYEEPNAREIQPTAGRTIYEHVGN